METVNYLVCPFNFTERRGQEMGGGPSFETAVSALLEMKKRSAESDGIDNRVLKVLRPISKESSLLITTAKPVTDVVDLQLATAAFSGSKKSKIKKNEQNEALKPITRYLTEDLKYELLIGEGETIELKAYHSKKEKKKAENSVTKKGFPSIDKIDRTRRSNSKGERQFCVNLSTHKGKEFWIDQSSAEIMIALQPEQPRYVVKDFLNWRFDKKGVLRATVHWNGFDSKKDRNRVAIEKGSDLHRAFISLKEFDPYQKEKN